MPKKVILGQRPEVIRRNIEVRLPDGEIGIIRVDFKYRSRTEFAEYLDGLLKRISDAAKAAETAAVAPAEAPKPKRGKKAEPATEAAPAEPWTQLKAAEASIKANVDNLLDIVVGWDLDIPFGREGLTQLCDELPGAVQALIEGYRTAVNLGHLGN